MQTNLHSLVRRLHPQPQSQSLSGFTLLELIVVLMMLGILSAIALPSFLQQAKRAQETEAKLAVGNINRAQQLYFAENSQFGALADLEVKLADSRNYTYESTPEESNPAVAVTIADPDAPNLRGFAGKVWLTSPEAGEVSQSILCEGDLGEVPEVDGELCP
ncbi:type IV pilin protein [Egbenema bharatensis]|uniref:type IV pilin protein n=1 Tax=Egbenema bharatensis TaxID=3463334 RepID=UPI003A8860EC